jgi:hypothetical protein
MQFEPWAQQLLRSGLAAVLSLVLSLGGSALKLVLRRLSARRVQMRSARRQAIKEGDGSRKRF